MKTAPAAQHRRPDKPHGKLRSANRLAVETVLRAAREALPITTIALRADVRPDRARKIVSHFVNSNDAHSVSAPGQRHLLYAWGQPRIETRQPAEPRLSYLERGNYTGAELLPYTGRPGAMDAFTLPSIQGGRAVERKRHVIVISANQKPLK
jgi:hypothetical protein